MLLALPFPLCPLMLRWVAWKIKTPSLACRCLTGPQTQGCPQQLRPKQVLSRHSSTPAQVQLLV